MVYYPSAGTFGISLTVSNAAGNSSVTKSQFLNVKSLYSSYHASWSENFENKTQLPKPDISVTSAYDNISFELDNTVGQSSGQSISLDNYSALAGDIDAVISPVLFTQFTDDLTLTFDYAFAKKTSINNDIFTVSISSDCGESWIIVRTYQGNVLETASNISTPFKPQNNNEWKSETVDLSIYRILFDQILIKFELSGDGGNNFYLDNINFTSSNVSLEENENQKGFSVYPNPNNGQFTLELNGGLEKEADLTIYTIGGQKVYAENLTNTEGTAEFIIDQALPAGVYFIRLKSGDTISEEKFIVK